MNARNLKLIGIVIFIILLLNLLLFALGRINDLIFWIVIALGALFVYFVLPKLKNS